MTWTSTTSDGCRTTTETSENCVSTAGVKPVPLLPLKQSDVLADPPAGINQLLVTVVARINSLAPAHPTIKAPLQFLVQFTKEDFTRDDLSFVNQMLTFVSKSANSLAAFNPSVNVPAVPTPKFKPSDMADPNLHALNDWFSALNKFLNSF